MTAPRVLLMPGSGDRSDALQRELTARARCWAQKISPAAVVAASGGVGAEVAALFRDGAGAVFVVWPDLARWRPDHAAGALDDLSHGCQLSVGPMFDAGFYLVAFGRPVPALLELDDAAWQTPDPIGLAADAARRSGEAIGLLRAERGVRSTADVMALRADPLLDDDLRRLLG